MCYSSKCACIFLSIGIVSGSLLSCKPAPEKPVPKVVQNNTLFNGKNLYGLTQLNGTAGYTVENGELVGKSWLGSSSSFLCSDKIFNDFILEFDVKCDTALNSGVQIRSGSNPQYHNGKVFGYQVEIGDQAETGWSGGIYEEGGRGWLYTLKNNETGKNAYKKGEWNHFRIEVIGPEIKIWTNAIPAAYLIDDQMNSGFIGFQVDSVPNEQKYENLEVRWKNITVRTDSLDKYSVPIDLNPINTSGKTVSSD